MIGLDTSALVSIFRQDPNIKEVLESINEQISTSMINYQEILFGLDLDKVEHQKENEISEQFFDDILLFIMDRNSAKIASDIYWELKKKGCDIGKFDSMIAGILLANGVNKIITKNTKYFGLIPGLKVIDY